MSIEEYHSARQLGQKESRSRAAKGQYPYLQVLDEVLRFTEVQGEEDLGLVKIPMDHIVGTKTEGRRSAFAANFMPLLEEESEFAAKWSALSDAHLKEGIRDPITAWEFMNRFYVQEGNKRVSVLKYFGAVSVPGLVRRIVPKRQDTPESRIYFDFLEFYRLTGINYLWFSQPGRFKALLETVKGDLSPWSEDERAAFFAAYARFRRAFKAMGGDKLPGTTGDAFLAGAKLYGYEALRRCGEDELRAGLAKSWKELTAWSIPEPVELELSPEPAPKSLLNKILSPKPELLYVLFLYERSPDTSAWTHGHDAGRRAAETALWGRVVTRCEADVSPDRVEEVIAKGVEEGVDVVFTTSPKLLPGCLKAAVDHPDVKFLNCSVFSSHPSIRSYYGRMYEVKFLAGALAGAMTRTHRLGYVADYPIYGTVSAVNAFALGARMTDPWAKVCLEWRCTGEEGIWQRLVDRGVDMISGLDQNSPVDPWRVYGLYRVSEGTGERIAAADWDWGRFYEQILKSILDGEWKQAGERAINYWWGLSAGVVDLRCTEAVPREAARLVELLRSDLIAGRFRPFAGPLTDREGRQVLGEGGELTAEEIVKMDWLAENVEGEIPAMDALTQEARELCRIQGLGREDGP